MFLADHVYIPIADLDTKERMFSADIYYHVKCFTKYIQRIKTVNASLIPMNKEFLKNSLEIISSFVNLTDKINFQRSFIPQWISLMSLTHFGR